MSGAEGERRRAARAEQAALFRYRLIREAADPALSTRQRGRWLSCFFPETGLAAFIPGLWRHVVLFLMRLAGVGWMCAAPMGVLPAGGSRPDGDVLARWAAWAAVRGWSPGARYCDSRSTGGSRPRTGRTPSPRGRGSCSRR
jgi:hypothetical protein